MKKRAFDPSTFLATIGGGRKIVSVSERKRYSHKAMWRMLSSISKTAKCVNQQGEICSWNAAAEKLFGYSASEAIGKSCYELLQCTGSLGIKLCTPSFTRARLPRNIAESPTLIWKPPCVPAGGYGGICQACSSKMAVLTRVSWCIYPATSQKESSMRTSCTECCNSPNRLLQYRMEMDEGTRLPFPLSPNRSKAYCAFSQMARILPKSPGHLGSACKPSATISTTLTTS